MKNLKNKFMLLGVVTLMAFGAVSLVHENLTAQVMEIPCEEFKYAFDRDILDCKGAGKSCSRCGPIKI
ncbi:MAG: hypothetical protein ACI9L9_001428 [Marivirga sp.]|jgi:hypothetical protein